MGVEGTNSFCILPARNVGRSDAAACPSKMGALMITFRLTDLFACTAAALVMMSASAGAQTTITQASDAELPAIIVEGATIEVKSAIKPAAKPKPVAVEEDEPQQGPKKSAAKSAKPNAPVQKSAQKSAPTSEPEAAPAAASIAAPTAASASGESNAAGNGDNVSGLPIAKVGSSVSVVTETDLKAQQISNPADALRSLPGVAVSQQGTPAGITVVRIRGAESNHTLVVIDGVEVNSNDTNGFFDFSNLTSEEISSVEVLRGPQSGLYGGGALGGVVNINTYDGRGPLRLRVTGEAGSFGTQVGSAQISGGNDRAHGSLTVQRRHSDGFNISPLGGERDGSDISSVAFRGGVVVFDNLSLDGSLRYSSRKGDRDGFDGSRSIGGLAVANDDASTFTQKLWTGRLAAKLDTFDKRWLHEFAVSRADSRLTDNDTTFFSVTRSEAEAIKYAYTSTYRIDGYGLPMRHFLTGRAEHLDESFTQPTFDLTTRERGRSSVVGEVRGEYYDHLFLEGTVRQDWNEVFTDETTWHSSASLKVPGTFLRLHASGGTGVKYPSFSQQFGFFFGYIANPDLKPETSIGWDSGAEVTLFDGKAVFDVTYFDQNLENEIASRFLPNFTSTAVNRVGESTRRGIEVSARAIVLPGLTVGGAYTYLDARDDNNLEEIRRAPHSGRVDANYNFLATRANFNIAAIYNGDAKDLAFDANSFDVRRVTLGEYWLVRLAASYAIAPGVELFGRVENALDEDYHEVFGYQTAGLAAYAGMRFSYEEPIRPVAVDLH